MSHHRYLIFGAHMDDELTMAGTIAMLARQGAKVSVVIMTDGSEGYPAPHLQTRIATLRRKEAAACDRVLGIKERIFLDQPDMGLSFDKAVVQACIRIIRRIRPEAIFTHGPLDNHGDHRVTHRITVDAAWHAGQPVSAVLGPRWATPVLYYYKGVGPGMDPLPTVNIDVSRTAHKRFEALATQTSQFALFHADRASLLAKARAVKKADAPAAETFWIAPGNRFASLLKP